MAVRDDFTAGEVLAAADLNDTFASKLDYALPVNAQTGTAYTFVAADAEKLTTASNGSAVTLTIPPQSSVTWSDNTVLRVVNYGAGAVTIAGGSGVTVTNTSSTIAQYGAAVAIRTGSDAWTVVPFGGGDVPSATVSSPAATGQYTDAGITYDYYTFTASGTLTVDTAGFVDVLVIGGGGGGGGGVNNGGFRCGGGGGAGGYLAITDAYVAAGTVTVTVGAGGAGASLVSGSTGGHSLFDSYFATGGAGGGGGQSKGLDGASGSGAGSSIGAISGGAGVSGLGNNGGGAGGVSGNAGGGGGGASAVGSTVVTGDVGGNGGAGTASDLTGSSVTRGGGGGGGGGTTAGSGGAGGGGDGGLGGAGVAGSANTGGGGGGSGNNVGTAFSGGNGGSGVVIVRVKV